MAKIGIVKGDTSPIYKWLQRKDLNGVSDAQVKWNFNKFLIDESGHWIAHYPSKVAPLDTAITNWIVPPSQHSGPKP
jgi:glutathione peroxidase